MQFIECPVPNEKAAVLELTAIGIERQRNAFMKSKVIVSVRHSPIWT